ncbi:MAG TPA: sigma-70 family RNA polymerase sigma factor, partial [Thermoanaerobaculia bacterium]|nr:sigma-70 family RNA polymerase sigma factor [Thermoanaerobaculia bacterium]
MRDPDDPLESQAIAAVKGGDRAAYDYLVRKYTRRVVSIAWGIVRNAADAEDLAQEAFVKAFQSIDRFRGGDPFGPWIYRIVTNLALDVMKHRTKFRAEEITGSEPAGRRDSADLG